MTSLRIATFLSHPNQHFAPLFRELSRVEGVELRVFYGCDWGAQPYRDPGFNTTFSWDVDLMAGYDSEFLTPKRPPQRLAFWELDNPEITARLAAFRPHVLYLHGYNHRTCWRASAWGRNRCAVFHFGDSELLSQRGWLKQAFKQLLLRPYFRRFHGFITIGDNNEADYRHYGVPQTKLFRGAYLIDLDRFRRTVGGPGRPSRADIRRRFALPEGATVALQVGKLQMSKRPLDLVAAIGQLRSQGTDVHALYVGDGPLRPEVEGSVRTLGLEGRVVVSGFINQTELPLILSAGDFLVSASESDPHPLVVSESMAVGLPIIASDRIGCVGRTDAARPDVNTLLYRCGDIADLARQIRRLVEEPGLRHRLGAASADLASTQDVSVTLAALFRAILTVRARFAQKWADVDEQVFGALADLAEVPLPQPVGSGLPRPIAGEGQPR